MKQQTRTSPYALHIRMKVIITKCLHISRRLFRWCSVFCCSHRSMRTHKVYRCTFWQPSIASSRQRHDSLGSATIPLAAVSRHLHIFPKRTSPFSRHLQKSSNIFKKGPTLFQDIWKYFQKGPALFQDILNSNSKRANPF